MRRDEPAEAAFVPKLRTRLPRSTSSRKPPSSGGGQKPRLECTALYIGFHAVAAARSDSKIVDFGDPPVIEVALAVQFDEPAVDTFDVAGFGRRIRETFPHRTEQPPLAPIEETFDEPPTVVQPIRFEVLETPPIPRFWFATEDGARLLQIQHDRVALNWRKTGGGADYPRYGVLRSEFERYLDELESVLDAEGKGRLDPNWCEVTYINHVDRVVDGAPLPLHALLTIVREADSEVLPTAEDAQLAQRFRITDGDRPIGRLAIQANAAFRTADGSPLWTLALTARVLSSEGSVQDALRCLDHGREWVVRGFYDLTTMAMHERWQETPTG